MAINLTSIGVKVAYAIEATAGTRPATGYKHIPQITEIPDMDAEPEALETTSLDNLDYRTYISGLKDLGGSLAFTANLTQDLLDLWNGDGSTTGVIGEYETAKKAGKAMWLAVVIPGLDKSVFFTVEPSPIGLMGMGVNEVIDCSIYVTPTGEPKWDTALTDEAFADAEAMSAMNFKY